ncbi:group XV phospholipase A2, partial [Elysia marginata]
MRPGSQSQRIKSLTKDTANALHWTCKCLIELANFLLTTDSALRHQYVALGFFQQNDIEHHFAHFRMAAG